MTIEEINSLLLSDHLEEISSRLRSKEVAKLYLGDATPTAEDLEAIQNIVFPEAELEAEFQIFKDELLVIEVERMRLVDLKDRLDRLSDHNAAHHAINPDIPNRDLWANKKILENSSKTAAEAHIAALEAADSQIKDQRSLVAYKELRRADLPSIADQLDMLYWDKVNGTDLWEAEIKKTKDKHPKPL